MTLKEKFKKEGFSNFEYLSNVAETFAIGYARFMLGDDAWRADDETLENYKKLIYEQSKK